jgi:hypothetical protein
LLLAPAQFAGMLLGLQFERREQREDVGDRVRNLPPGFRQIGAHFEIFAHGHFRK